MLEIAGNKLLALTLTYFFSFDFNRKKRKKFYVTVPYFDTPCGPTLNYTLARCLVGFILLNFVCAYEQPANFI